jgi:hypothetical protein
VPRGWRLTQWAEYVPEVILGDTLRTQSLDVIYDYVKEGMDFRRFQVELDPDIDFTDSSPATMARMTTLGDELGERVLNNQYASLENPQYDPEGIFEVMTRYECSARCPRGKMLREM